MSHVTAVDLDELDDLVRHIGDDDLTSLTVEHRTTPRGSRWRVAWSVQEFGPTQRASASSTWHPTLRDAIRQMKEGM